MSVRLDVNFGLKHKLLHNDYHSIVRQKKKKNRENSSNLDISEVDHLTLKTQMFH